MRHILKLTDSGRSPVRFLCGLALASAMLTGCVREDSEVPAGLGRTGEAEISFTVDGLAATRAVAITPHEAKVSDVDILFFDRDGAYVTHQHADVSVGADKFAFNVPSQLTEGTMYRILIVGNGHEHIPSGFETFNAYLLFLTTREGTYDAIRQKLYAMVNLTHHGSGAVGTAGLPMWGELQNPYTGAPCDFSFTGNRTSGYVINAKIHFRRSVCRIDLRNNDVAQLIINRVKLCNYRKGGYYFHENSAWAPESGSGLGGLDEGSWIDVAATNEPEAGVRPKYQEVRGKIYAFPNMVPVVAQNDKATTYLMIEGYYQDGTDNTPENPRSKATYYRLNMAQNGQSQFLQRNYIYQGTINRAKGPGAATAQEAAGASGSLLDYNVGEEWKDDDNTSITDNQGNFLIVSQGTLSFAAQKDLTEVVKVQVNDGNAWTLEWDTTDSKAQDQACFEFSKPEDDMFSVRTKEDNNTDFVRRARLKVTASGPTINPDSPLVAIVNVVQYSQSGDIRTLMVDEKVGTIEQPVPGQGSTIRMQVQTGSRKAMWKAVEGEGSPAALGVKWTTGGVNNALLTVDVPANTTGEERSFSLVVSRLIEDGITDTETDPVTVVFTQKESGDLISISPNIKQLSIEGFSAKPETDITTSNLEKGHNSVVASRNITVSLVDPTHYTVTVQSNFNKNYDVFLHKDRIFTSLITATYWGKENKETFDNLTGLKHGDSFWIHVFRTGPGDPVITGMITITAVPNAGTNGRSHTISLPVTVTTSCSVGDVIIPQGDNYLLVADRNVGATPRFVNNQYVPSQYYTNEANKVHITGKEGPDNDNEDFSGTIWDRKILNDAEGFIAEQWLSNDPAATNVDATGSLSPWYKLEDISKWKLPSKSDLDAIKPYIIYSKRRAFIISEAKDGSGNYIGCYLPYSSNIPYISTTLGSSNPYVLDIFPSTEGIDVKTYSISRYVARCVRDVTAEEFNAWQNGQL